MKQWRHKVDEKWLEARATVLSATDVCKLIPKYKKVSKKAREEGKLIPAFAAMWGDKHAVKDIDPWSFNAAARGHIMEPYCVEALNKQSIGDIMYHWDDCIIRRGFIGFSPDALDIRQPAGYVTIDVNDEGKLYTPDCDFIDSPTELVEIKSFEAYHHFECCAKDKMEQDEVMQIAVAMYVLPSLECCHLVYYCPGAPIEMKVFSYDREDLKDKIGIVDMIVKEWERTCIACIKLLESDGCYSAIYTEDEIYSEWVAMQDQYTTFTE